MLHRISKKKALNAVTIITAAVIVFHILVLTQIIPYDIVWAGRLNSLGEMYRFEAVSLAVNLFLVAVLLLKARRIPHIIPEFVLNGILWAFTVLFALNTIANLIAKSLFEMAVFTPITLILTVLLVTTLKKRSGRTY